MKVQCDDSLNASSERSSKKERSDYPSGNRKRPALLSVRHSGLRMRITIDVHFIASCRYRYIYIDLALTCDLRKMMAAVQRLAVGSTSSLEKLEAVVNACQSEKFVQLVKRDTRTLEMAKKRVPKRVEGANTALVYYSIHYTCGFGGKTYKNEGSGQRRNQRWVL